MSCVTQQATFRLLDAWVGWSESHVEQLTGLDDELGVTLAKLPTGLTSSDLSQAIPPARLARGCGACEWYLATPCEPRSRLLFKNPCYPDWHPVWGCGSPPGEVICVEALAGDDDCVALSDSGAHKLWLLRDQGRKLVAGVPFEKPGALTHTPWGGWLVVDRGQNMLRRFDPAGGEGQAGFPTLDAPVDRLAFDSRCRLWIIFVIDQAFVIRYAEAGDTSWTESDLDGLLQAFPEPTGLVISNWHGFCLSQSKPMQSERICCYDWYGRSRSQADIEARATAVYESAGQLLTLALDSGIPRCRWHRVRIDADVPDETAVILSVSSHEEADPPPQGNETDPQWQAFEAGIPHPSDWQSTVTDVSDMLIDQPPGRYLFVRLRLSGNGLATPTVHRVRIDFPRQTSIDALPVVYRDNPDAEAFTERFLSLFDAAIEDMDQAIERYPTLLDSEGVAPEVLPWLGAFLDIAMDASWSEERRRKILAAVPELYRRRGTRAGLEQAVRLLFDVTPVIEEASLERMWGALGKARLGQVRTFNPARARFRVGYSPLSGAPISSYGNPDSDPLTAQAHRFRIFVPGFESAAGMARVAALIESQKPAHTLASFRLSKQGFVLGGGSRVGVDTAIAALPPPVLNNPDLRLNRASILWHGSSCHGPAVKAGQTSVIGVNTVME